MEIIYTEPNTILKTAQESLGIMLNKHKDTDTLLMLSGGSALSLIDILPKDILWNNVTITTLDERYTHTDTESNFAQILNKDSIHFIKNTTHFIDPRPKATESLEETAKRFSVSLHTWSDTHPNGKIIATVGVGEDGHTAGMLPFPENPVLFDKLFNNKDSWICGYEVSKDKNIHTKRITVTNTFLKEKITEALIYITGETKRKPLIKLLSPTGNISETPAYSINNIKTTTLLTDIKI